MVNVRVVNVRTRVHRYIRQGLGLGLRLGLGLGLGTIRR